MTTPSPSPIAMEDVKKSSSSCGLVHFFFVLSISLCALFYAPRLLVRAPYYYATDLFAPAADDPNTSHAAGGGGGVAPMMAFDLDNQVRSPCSSMANHTICCDRSDFNTDVCFMAGDVRTDAASLSLLLFPPPQPQGSNVTTTTEEEEEKVRPYPRKWERFIMGKVQEVRLRAGRPEEAPECDVRHDAPAFVMTAGGYTGNLFHAFNDGFVPAWVTVQHLRRRVVLAVLSYNPWWAGTFGEIISGLSDHRVVDLLHDRRTHCFPGAIVGSRFHGILKVDPARLRDNRTIVDFNRMLASVYESKEEEEEIARRRRRSRRPRLGLVSRKGTRVIENEAAVAAAATAVGFDVEILETANGMPLSAVYASVRSYDALVGVHGADLTKFLFLRAAGRAALVQIAPLGVSPIARGCFGEASERMGVEYEQYDVRREESSLARRYAADDVVVADPEAAKREKGGWGLVARVYLGAQNVTLDLHRFRNTLAGLHARALLHLQQHHNQNQNP